MSNLIGQTLGPYRIIEQIGIGGMATVYKAYQPSMDRYVAIKVLPAILSRDPAFLKRFRREAKVVAKLEHKHILPVHDYGEQEGLTYLVMRYVEAGTLKDQLAAGQLDLPAIYRIIAQVGSALDWATDRIQADGQALGLEQVAQVIGQGDDLHILLRVEHRYRDFRYR